MATSMTIPSVQLAFQKLDEGVTTEYDTLLRCLCDPEIKDESLNKIFEDLQGVINKLGKDQEVLVNILMQKVRWTDRSQRTILLYQRFILNLLSAYTFYVKTALTMIIRQFVPLKPAMNADDVDTSEKKVADAACFVHLHSLLKAVLQIIPMAPMLMIPLLAEKFPYHSKASYVLECYIRNLLQLSFYLPQHRDKIMELIVEKITKMDIRVPRDEIQEIEENSDDEDNMEIFDMEELDKSTIKTSPQKKIHKDAEKLDTCMFQLFNHIRHACCPQGQLDWPATRELYRQFLTIFDKVLLPTHCSCHVQFIMFYICSLRSALTDGFLDYLWKKVQNPNTQPIYRQAAVAYIGSFVSRANFITASTVKDVLDLMVPWVHVYIKESSDTKIRADVKYHGPFYSVCQTLFYIFVFRLKDLLHMPDGLRYCHSLNLQTIITCRLNPLKFCLPTVVTTFASLARQHQIAFCDTIMEKNKRSIQPEAGSHTSQVARLTQINPLDSFFPFDPYLLERSSEFIQPLYREYDGVAVVNNEELSEDDQEDDDFMDVGSYTDAKESKVFGSSLSSSVGLYKSPSSPSCVDFLLHGTSPGFKQP